MSQSKILLIAVIVLLSAGVTSPITATANNAITAPSSVVSIPQTCVSDSIYVLWSPVTDAVRYVVAFKKNVGLYTETNWGILPQVSGFDYLHENLAPGVTYAFKVQSVGKTAVSAWSSETIAISPSRCPTPAPTPTPAPAPTPTPTPTPAPAPTPTPAPAPTPTPTPTPPTISGFKSDRVLEYTISILQYVKKLIAYERNPIGKAPIPPTLQQF